MLGEEHPDTLSSMAHLASTFGNQERWKEAEGLDVQVLEARKRVLGEEHPDTLSSMHNLAFTWKFQGFNDKALGFMTECSERRKRKIGLDHPDAVASLEALNQWQMEQSSKKNHRLQSAFSLVRKKSQSQIMYFGRNWRHLIPILAIWIFFNYFDSLRALVSKPSLESVGANDGGITE